MTDSLLGMTPAALTDLARGHGLRPFRGRQLAQWLYHRHARTFEEMTNLSKDDRRTLSERFTLGHTEPVRRLESADGTLKYAFPVEARPGGQPARIVETTVIPDRRRLTLCLSTQIGCARGCAICATGRLGFHGNLTPARIINQYESLPERDEITNIVYMGMGEPLDTIDAVLESLEVFTATDAYAFSPRRITVSTIGIPGPLERLLAESEAHVAISLHSPFPEERARLIPAETQHPISESLEILRNRRWDGQRRLSFEYALVGGLNDSADHARAVAKLLFGLPARVNLIPVNPATGLGFAPPPPDRVDAFLRALHGAGVRTTVRASRGADIEAACGLLAGRSESVG